jgi:hypothetical protein
MAGGADMLAAIIPAGSLGQLIWELDAPPLEPLPPIFLKPTLVEMDVGTTGRVEAEPGDGGESR